MRSPAVTLLFRGSIHGLSGAGKSEKSRAAQWQRLLSRDARADSSLEPYVHVKRRGRSTGRPFVIGVAGPSASGKTTVCKRLIQGLNHHRCMLVTMDWFYRGMPKGWSDPATYNFDHPDAIDFELMLCTMKKVQRQERTSVPTYNFETHGRTKKLEELVPADVVIIEGIFAFYDRRLREMMDMRVFVDEDSDICLARRIRRDVASRGRDVSDVLDRYVRFVKPSYEEMISPTKRFADIIIPRGRENVVAIDLLLQVLRQKLHDSNLSRVYSNLVMLRRTGQSQCLLEHVAASRRQLHKSLKKPQAPNQYMDRLARLVVEEALAAASPLTSPIPHRIIGLVTSPEAKPIADSLLAIAPTTAGAVSVSIDRDDATWKGARFADVLMIFAFDLLSVKAVKNILRRQASKGLSMEKTVVVALRASEEAVRDICQTYPKTRLVVAELTHGPSSMGVSAARSGQSNIKSSATPAKTVLSLTSSKKRRKR